MGNNIFRPNILGALRAYKGIDQEALANDTGLSRPTIQRLESGKTKTPTLDTMQKLADYFGVNTNVFHSDQTLSLK